MGESTQDQIFQVENLLRSFSATHGVPQMEQPAPTRTWSFDSRPMIAACLALLIFAPGCAVAAVLLMRTDGDIPPIEAPAGNPPVVTKSDRLPLAEWSAEAAERLGTKDVARLATAAALADPSFLAPILIRGTLEDGTITTFIEPAAVVDNDVSVPKPRPKRDVRRIKPLRIVAELSPPEPPQPSFFERLFGPHPH